MQEDPPMGKRKLLVFGGVTAAAGLVLAGPAGAQEIADTFDRSAAEGASAMNTIVLDNIFVFVCAVLVFLMQPGFALLEAGLTSARNVANIMMKNLMDAAVGVLVFALIGWNIAYSGATWFGVADGSWSIFGVADLANLFPGAAPEVLAEGGYPLAVPVDWLFQAAFAATAATIVSGAVAGRIQFRGYLVYTAVITALVYPIIVNLHWGGGWLSQQGFVDFAGSGIVHLTGGMAAVMGAIVLGPRLGKYGPDGKPRAMPGHSIPLALTGVFLLFIGWFGFNPGSQLQADMAVPYIAVQTLLSASVAAVMAMVTSWVLLKKPDVSMAGNGMLAGLVAICAGVGNFVSLGTVATGAVAGVLVVVSVLVVERLKVDDPVGAFSVHGMCGAWGLIAVGLFASPASPVDGTAAGLFYGGGLSLLGTQLVGLALIALVVGVLSFALFAALKAAGLLRVSAEEELAGLDVVEHGAPGYGPDIMVPATPAAVG
jgi:Amt family ammonium transporter